MENDDNSGSHSAVRKQSGTRFEIAVLPLDNIVSELGLDRVDFIRMDIEGAERQALQGAAKTISRFQPGMAICTYHLPDDRWVIPEIVRAIHPPYRIHAGHVETPGWLNFTPKIVFFQ